MKIPLSWLKDFINLDGISVEEIARKLTLAGLEVDEIRHAGIPLASPKAGEAQNSRQRAWDGTGTRSSWQRSAR